MFEVWNSDRLAGNKARSCPEHTGTNVKFKEKKLEQEPRMCFVSGLLLN